MIGCALVRGWRRSDFRKTPLCSRIWYQRLPVLPLPPVSGLDLSVPPPPPPLTSFTGSRSRILAFLIRRQTEWTTAIFGVCAFIANHFAAMFALGCSTDTLLAPALIAKHSLKSPLCARALRSHCQLHRKRESRHYVDANTIV